MLVNQMVEAERASARDAVPEDMDLLQEAAMRLHDSCFIVRSALKHADAPLFAARQTCCNCMWVKIMPIARN